jgi:hypothetical protein
MIDTLPAIVGLVLAVPTFVLAALALTHDRS